MKKGMIFFALISILFSCNNEDDNASNTGLVGVWKLTQILADPGDGSGTFMNVSSNKTIQFNPDGSLTSNGLICDMSIETNVPSSGTYSLTEMTIISTECNNSGLLINFELTSTSLIINYPCFEACRAKYIKLQ